MRHRSDERAPTRRGLVVSILLRALVAAAVGGGLALGVLGWDWAKTRARPIEDTVVVSVHQTGGEMRCGKYVRDSESVTRRSADPPAGLPAVFTDVEACDVPSVGDRQAVARVPRGTQSPKVYADPSRSLGEVVSMAFAVAGVFLVMALAVFGAKELWRSTRLRLAARRQNR